MSPKLVILRIKGGLGNQLFQYNLGEYLNQELGYNIKYDIKTGYLNDAFNRSVCFHSIFKDNNKLIYKGVYNNIHTLRILKLISIHFKTNLFNYFYLDEDNNINKQTLFSYLKISQNKIILEGYWQDLDLIYNKFLEKLNNSLTEAFFSFTTNDLIVHYRSDNFSDSLSFEYFYLSINNMINRYPNINNIYIYSDSNKVTNLLNYLKDRISINIHIDYNDYDPFLLLYTISKSKFFIGSNGTFSLWAMLLGTNRVIFTPPTLSSITSSLNGNIYLNSNE